MDEPKAALTIKAVSERTGVSTHTLRAWERRYGIPRPRRDVGNRYRLYDEQDITDVLWLKHQIEAGLTPARASALRRLERAQATPTALAAAQPLTAVRQALTEALMASDAPMAQRMLDEALALFSFEQVAQHILEPVMNQLGECWQRNELGIWQEHLATHLIRQRLLALLQAQPEWSSPAPALVAACAPEEQHELGLLILALLARRQGWRVTFLGQRTPLRDLRALAERHRWIALSVTTAAGLASLLPLFTDPAWQGAPLLWGGYLLNQLPHLQEHLPGVFLATHAAEAIRTLTTATPKANLWKPDKKALHAALTLQRERLRLSSQQLEQFFSGTRSRRQSARTAGQVTAGQMLVTPTLFVMDTLIGALAFQVTELVDMQAHWLTQFLPSYGIPLVQLEQYWASFVHVLRRHLDKDTVRQVGPLLERFRVPVPFHGAEKKNG